MSEKYNFTIEKKGYNTDQVDSVMDELNSKNKYLNARVAELEQKLDTARRLIRRFSESENGLRQSIADSKRAAAQMMTDTKNRSDSLLDKTRESCGEIISDLDMKIADRMNTADIIRTEVASFKDQLFALYSSHIDMIETIAATAENFVYEPDYSKVSDAVDEFESAGEITANIPEFPDYPQESIFAGFDEEKSNGFEMNENAFREKEEEKDFSDFGTDEEDSGEETAEEDFVYSGSAEFISDEDKSDAVDDVMIEDDYIEAAAEALPIEPVSEEFAEDISDKMIEEEIAREIEINEEINAHELFFSEEEAEEDENAEDAEEMIPDELFEDAEDANEADELEEDDFSEKSADEYYQFLENFINEDDGNFSDPE